MSGKSLSYEYVRVAEHATCTDGRRHEYAGQRGLVLGLTWCRRRWRVQMADHTVIALPRTLLRHAQHPPIQPPTRLRTDDREQSHY